ncbi:MAG: hypothetical protein MI919_36530, partial [Holophagales bacterium]|nr:hypothetical protein [Holophagales bacterium]
MSPGIATFPRQRLGDALWALAARLPGCRAPTPDCADLDGAAVGSANLPAAGAEGSSTLRLGEEAGLPASAARLGLEAWPVRVDHGELTAFLETTGPALVWPAGLPDRIVAIVHGGRRWCRAEGPGRGRILTRELQDQLTHDARLQTSEAAV